MRLKQIAALCKESGRILLYDRETSDDHIDQWIGDGSSCYPIFGLPYMEMDHIVNIFDLSEKKQEKIILRHEHVPQTMNFNDTDPNEIRVEPGPFTVNYAGRTIMAVSTPSGLAYIQHKYVWPLAQDYDGVDIFRRTSTGGGEYFAIKAGLMLVGIAMPYIGHLDDKFVSAMERMARDTRMKLSAKKLMEEMPGQVSVTVKDTGEVVEET